MEKEVLNNDHYHIVQDKMSLFPAYYSWILSKFKSSLKGSIIDLGTGKGVIVNEYLDISNDLTLVDFNPEIVRYLKEEYSTTKVHNLDLCSEQWSSELEKKFDCIVSLDLLEHMSDEHKFFENINKVLKSNGVFIVKVPAQSALYSEMDKASGHYRRYDPEDFHKLAKKHSLAISQIKSFNKFGALLYKFKNSQKKNFSSTMPIWQIKLANIIIPIFSLIDYILPSKGLSYIVTFRKI